MATTSVENVSSAMNGATVANATVHPSLYPYTARIGVSFVWILASVLGIVGNFLVICSVILSKKPRTITNAFVVNLSVADFWTSLCYPWQVVAILSEDTWPLQTEVPCFIAAVQLYTGLGASLYSLAAIAFNRLVLITQSVDTYRWWFSPCKVVGMIAATWVIPLVAFFLPPILGVGAIGYDPQDNVCLDKDGHPRGPVYNLAQALGLYPAPLTIIVGSYTALCAHLHRHFRRRRKRSAENAHTLDAERGGEGSTIVIVSDGMTIDDVATDARRAISRQQLAITKNLFVAFCIFFLLVSPYSISLAIPTSRQFALYGLTIAILNSCVNPIIYTVKHPHFKLVLRKMIRCRFSEIPEPTDWLKFILLQRREMRRSSL